MRPDGTPQWLLSLQTASWGNWQKPAHAKNSCQGQLSWISVFGARMRKEGRFHVVLSFSNSDWQEGTLVMDSFSSRSIYCLLACHTLCPDNLVWQLLVWGPQYIWPDRKVGSTSFVARHGWTEILVALQIHSQMFLIFCIHWAYEYHEFFHIL